MKKHHHYLIIFFAVILGLFAASELNYRQAMDKASKTEGTDGEIVSVMRSHGFDIESPFDEITIWDKVDALSSCLSADTHED